MKSRKSFRSSEGPDGCRSWVMAGCCFYIYVATYGIFRSSGIIYVAFIQTYDVTREEASWPFSLCGFVMSCSGFLVSIFSKHFSLRVILLLGSAVSSLGMTMCYFFDSLFWITVSIGVIYGTGFGLLVVFCVVRVNQYFLKYRTTAMGIVFSGGSIGSLILPSVVQKLLEIYGLKGTFLLLGGLTLNTIVASAVLRDPSWLELNPRDDDIKNVEDCDTPFGNAVKSSDILTTAKALNCDCKTVNRADTVSNTVALISSEMLEDDSTLEKSSQSDVKNNSNRSLNAINSHERRIQTSSEHLEELLPNVDEMVNNNDIDATVKGRLNPQQNSNSALKPVVTKRLKRGIYSDLKSICSLLTNVMYNINNLTITFFFLLLHTFFIIAVDFAMDKGLPEEKALYLLVVFASADLFGRLGLGWVTDHGFLGKKTVVIGNSMAMGLLVQFYPLCYSYSSLLTVSACYGVLVGSSVALLYVTMPDFVGIENISLATGFSALCQGIGSALRPTFIGFIRDGSGSYDLLFHVFGALCILVGPLWFLEPYIRKRKQGKKLRHPTDTII